MDNQVEAAVSEIAAAIGEPARARILYCLMDGHARTSTELSVVAAVSPSTASVHLQRLKTARLVKVLVCGKHRFYSLEGADVARILESLSVLAGRPRHKFVPSTPTRLRSARTCYDHMAGTVGVLMHDRFIALRWLSEGAGSGSDPKRKDAGRGNSRNRDDSYEVTPAGAQAFSGLGIDLDAIRKQRRRFACACLDWSERRPHLGGALGAAVLTAALKREWLVQDLDSRALAVTRFGRREMRSRFGVEI